MHEVTAASLLSQRSQGGKKQGKLTAEDFEYNIQQELEKAAATEPDLVQQPPLHAMEPSGSSTNVEYVQDLETAADDSTPESGAESDDNDGGFDAIVPNESNLRGGGCVSSLLCDKSELEERHREPNRERQLWNKQSGQESAQKTEVVQSECNEDEDEKECTAWKGWAEIENDPEIFTILLQDWGVPDTQVNEILDVADLLGADTTEILGLIFLSRYEPTKYSRASTPADLFFSKDIPQPWFANQISKFSCGTVALMNILMNADFHLSETLSDFRSSTSFMNAKHRGIALDANAQFRDTHNSFSTHLDRMIVDVLLKDDAAKHKQRKQVEAREAQKTANGDGADGASKKRKRGGAKFTRRRNVKKNDTTEDEENGFHFVAYVSAHGCVWKLDGLQTHPCGVGMIRPDQTWVNVAAADLVQQMEAALKEGEACSLMSVAKVTGSSARQKPEKERKQEDWAPFIEHMLRLHAEKGDLQEMLGV